MRTEAENNVIAAAVLLVKQKRQYKGSPRLVSVGPSKNGTTSIKYPRSWTGAERGLYEAVHALFQEENADD